jgi:hypothetical protein
MTAPAARAGPQARAVAGGAALGWPAVRTARAVPSADARDLDPPGGGEDRCGGNAYPAAIFVASDRFPIALRVV